MKKTYFILILLALVCFGCEKNITLDIPKYESKVVVYCILNPGETPTMTLSLSQSYYSYADTTGKPRNITNAQVIITDQNTNIKDTLRLDTGINLYFGKHSPIQGHHYIASINYQGKIITAETTVPMPVKIDHIDYVKVSYGYSSSGFSDSTYEFHIFFNDLPGEPDYYTVTQTDPHMIGTTDYADFTPDAGLDGKQLEIITDLNNSNGTTPSPPFVVQFQIDNATKETSDFLPNVYTQSYSANDPFSQPVIVSGNINGGLGLFGAITPSPAFFVTVKK